MRLFRCFTAELANIVFEVAPKMSKHHKRGKYSDSLEDEDAMKLARKSSKLHRGDSPSDLSDSEQDDDESLDNSSQDNQVRITS